MQGRNYHQLGLVCLFMILMASVPVSRAAKTLTDGDEPSNPLPCSCSDVDPRSYFTKADVEFQCFDQAKFGQCDQPFMRETQQEISEGYCQISCGRCDCCKSLGQVMREKGLNSMLWLLNFIAAGKDVELPGYMATIVAGSDSAVDAAIRSIGYSDRKQAENDSSKHDKLRALAQLHVIPPVYETRAVWTAPFFNNGVNVWTELAGSTGDKSKVIRTSRGGDGKIKMEGPSNSGYLYETDVYACKGYVQIIDTMLLP